MDNDAKVMAMDLLLELLAEISPDEKKPILLLPKAVHKLVTTATHMLDAVTTQQDEAEKRKCALQALAILEDAQNTFEMFLYSKGVME